MGSGGTHSLYPPGKLFESAAGATPAVPSNLVSLVQLTIQLDVRIRGQLTQLLGCYMVKPHGQLVLVSSMHCCTYTPSLSTS
jgi:hypothetical protein